jgi:hypothetical protein
MVFINEWLPNPIGVDAKGEFIEFWNNGGAPVGLSGWSLRTDGKKKFKLSGSIRANEYLVLPRSATKLSLKNTDGKLFLYDATGKLVDRSAFEGTAPEGQSFNRVSYNAYGSSSVYNTIQQFAWGKQTPGVKNSAIAEIGISDARYPVGVPLGANRMGLISVLGFAMLAGVIFAAALWYSMRKDENVSQLFFGGNENSWR